MRRLTRKWNQFTAKILDLPQDVVQDLPRITMIGNVQLYVENHRGVLHFSSENLKLELTKGTLEVFGKNLVISLGVLSWVCGFIFLMNKSIFEPVELNAMHPVWNIWWIAGWMFYMYLTIAAYVTYWEHD